MLTTGKILLIKIFHRFTARSFWNYSSFRVLRVKIAFYDGTIQCVLFDSKRVVAVHQSFFLSFLCLSFLILFNSHLYQQAKFSLTAEFATAFTSSAVSHAYSKTEIVKTYCKTIIKLNVVWFCN